MRSIANYAFLIMLAVAPICVAQTSKMAPTDKGFSSYTSFEQTHDSASNWSFKGGVSLEVVKNLSIEVAGYENVPIGNQKLYSKLYKSGGASGSGSASDPAYKKGSFTSGTGISEDNGFSTGVSTNQFCKFLVGNCRCDSTSNSESECVL